MLQIPAAGHCPGVPDLQPHFFIAPVNLTVSCVNTCLVSVPFSLDHRLQEGYKHNCSSHNAQLIGALDTCFLCVHVTECDVSEFH